MSAIKIGNILTCNDLFVVFWDECVDPAVKKDPYEVLYSIGFYESCNGQCFQKFFNESIDQVPIRDSLGTYWIPKISKNDAQLEPGNYFVKWKWKDLIDSNWQEICQEFTLYQVGHCLPFKGIKSKCDC